MNDHIKQVIKQIEDHRKANPKTHTYTIRLPSSFNIADTTGRALSGEEQANVQRQIELLKNSVIAAFKRELKDCYTNTDTEGAPILVVHYPMHEIEFKDEE